MKKKQKKNIPIGVVHVKASFNNTIVTVTDLNGNTIAWASAGSSGFKGTRKGTPFAAQLAAENVLAKTRDVGLKKVDVLVKGQGSGRETTIRSLQSTGVEILSIKDVTAIPYNGCRPPRRRRV